jgi:hypothetical protein
MEIIMNLHAKGKLHTKVMQEVHDAPTAGHYGEKTKKKLLGKTFYWLKMKEDIKHYVHMCVKCQNTKLVHKKTFGLYRPLPTPLGPFESVLMDFMTCLPKDMVKNVKRRKHRPSNS